MLMQQIKSSKILSQFRKVVNGNFDIEKYLEKRDAEERLQVRKAMLEAERKRNEDMKQKRKKLFDTSGLGNRFRKRTFENFVLNENNTEQYQLSRKFCNEFPNCEKGILFVGNYGTGKTHLSAAIANKLLQKMHSVVYINATDLILKIKDTYRKNSESTELEIIEHAVSSELLILDDLGKENATENTSSILYNIINRIYENERPIVITTNLTSEQLEERLGDKGKAIVSRLNEMCEPIPLIGQDRRFH